MLVESLAMAYSAVVPMLHNAAVTCSANARHKHGFLCVRWARVRPAAILARLLWLVGVARRV